MAGAKLKTYRAKRDFTKTAEPSGAGKVAAARHPRFVIQMHAATRLHYDLRLEIGGVFKSWAVTRGPSLDPQEKRLAVEVEDHPLDYGDFEGTIPKGEYGGGTVMLWDRGHWAPEPGFEDSEKALKKGELKFLLEGKKLHGSFVLVRMKRREREKRDNWLLIKHRDEHAIDGDGEGVLAADKSVASGRTMAQIAGGGGRKPSPFMTKKQAQADAVWHSRPVSRKPAFLAAAPKAKPPAAAKGKPIKALPDFIEPEFARPAAAPPKGPGWAHEIKFDGYRMQMRVEKGRARLFTRKGLDWTGKFPAIAREGEGPEDCILDGEICALDSKGVPHFESLQAAIAEADTDDLLFFAFDALAIGREDLRALPLRDRKARLRALLEGAPPVLRYVDHWETSGETVFIAARRMGLEGIVSKRLDAPYRSGSRGSWVKTKGRDGHEVVIGGWTEENGRFRSLLVGVNHEGDLLYSGRVGTGFGAGGAARLAAALKRVESPVSPFSGPNAPRRERGVRWARPDLVAEIEFAGFTEQGLVRQGAFKGLRTDKPAAEVEAEMPAKPTTKLANPARAAPQNISIRGVAISSPDKILWPAAGASPAFAKHDLAEYYEDVGAWLLDHIRGRPASIIRAPDGIAKELFFQRHAMKGSSPHLTLTQIAGDKAPYVQFDTLEALIAAAQIAAVEIHPWNCQPGAPEIPGRLVFDLDPAPDVDFARVIDAAKEVRERLAGLGLEAFCKTTGGKGLHVVTPFTKAREQADWTQAKSFAHELCAQMAADAPNLYLTTMAKKDRAGRIFLDYLRNDRTATAVAPLSPRARPGAPVSMPVNWAQVRAGLDPQRFTIATAPALLKKTRPWADYESGARPFLPAARKLLALRKH